MCRTINHFCPAEREAGAIVHAAAGHPGHAQPRAQNATHMPQFAPAEEDQESHQAGSEEEEGRENHQGSKCMCVCVRA